MTEGQPERPLDPDAAAPGGALVAGLRRHPLPLVVGFLLLLTVAFFYPVLAGGHFSTVPAHQGVVYPWAGLPPTGLTEYPQSDQADLSHPWHTFLTRALDQSSFPFWDANSYGGGYPFFANGSSATLYPPRLLAALALDPVRAHDAFLMLHVFLSGLFMYALMREFGTGRAGALLAAVSWMFAGFNMAWMHLEVVTPMSVFLPLDLLCVRRAHRTGSWPSTALAGLALGATLMSGHLILLGIVYMVAVAYAATLAAGAAFRALRAKSWQLALMPALRLMAMVAVSLGVAMVVLLPTAYALAGSQRDPFSYDDLVTSFLAPARTLLYGIVPPPLPVTQGRMHEMAFAGTATGLLAIGGFFLRRRGALAGAVILVVAFAVALGTPATWLAYQVVPGFKIFRPYSRLLVFAAFAIAVLGGVGLDALWRRSQRRSRSLPHGGDDRASLGHRAMVLVSVVVIGATALQLGRYGRDVNPPFVPRGVDAYFGPTPLTQALQREILPTGRWPGRVLPTRAFELGGPSGAPMLFAAESLVFGFDSMGGYDSAVPRRVTALVRILQGEETGSVLGQGLPSAYAPAFDSPSVRFDLVTRLGITVLATNPVPRLEQLSTGRPLPPVEVAYEGADGRVLRVVGGSSAPFVVHADEVVATPGDALRRFIDPGFDFNRAAVIESDDLRRAGASRLGDGTGVAKLVSATRGVNTARVIVTSSAPAWLMFHDSWAPGWTARVNGAAEDVVRANYAKRAVRVPAGRSEVVLRYRPPGLLPGATITLLTLLGCALALACTRPARSRRT